MSFRTDSLDWAMLQAFVAVAEAGSLSAAARRLGLSQPTLGRRVQAAEAALGVVLFRRVPRGLEPTEAAAALLGPARAMAEAAMALRLAAAGQDAGLAGPVRVTASVMVAQHLLPPILARLRADLPDVSIDLVPTDRNENLLFGEADIAVRMVRPEQLDLSARHLGDLPLGIFAARGYLARRGRPATVAELLSHDLVGEDREDRILRAMRALDLPARREDFATRCDDAATAWALMRAGCGLGFGPVAVGRADPELEEVTLPGVRLPALPVWLAAPERTRRSPRLSRVWTALAEGLRPLLVRPGGGAAPAA
jgi:DNA-binding transcriptional LysR family regulator